MQLDANQGYDLAHFRTLLSDRTKLVALPHVSNTLGCICPVKEVVEAAHAVGACVLLDACQSVPHMPVDVGVCMALDGQGCIRREGTSEAAPEAVRRAVGGGCRSGWGRLLSVTNPIEAGTCRQGDVAGRRLGALAGGGGGSVWVTVQGPVKKQQPDGMSHRGYLPPLPVHPWGREY